MKLSEQNGNRSGCIRYRTVKLLKLLQKQEYKEDKIIITGDAQFVRTGKGKNLWRNFSISFGKLKK
jgi:hypothetical protein